MGMKKMAKVMVLVLVILMVVPAMCFGANYTCNILQAGQTSGASGVAYVQLTDTAATPAFANRWFTLDTSGVKSNQMLATALTALSLGKTVTLSITSTAQFANVIAIYVAQ
jgi:hypothetical protein